MAMVVLSNKKFSRTNYRVLLISLEICGNMQLYGSNSTKVCLANSGI